MAIVFVGEHKDPYYICEPHKHSQWELVLHREGIGNTIIGEETYSIFPGQIILIPPEFIHSYKSKTGVYDRYVHIDEIKGFASDKPTLFRDEDHRIENLMWYLFVEFYGDSFNRKATAEALWDAVYQTLLGKYRQSVLPEKIGSFHSLLLQHLSDSDFSVSDAVKDTAYCEDHFRRLFKRYTGKTPAQYFCELRINYAKHLLTYEYPLQMSISDIARASGFKDPYYFTRCFHKNTGCSPSEYSHRK